MHPKNDMGNAAHLAERYSDVVRWGGTWWKYDGRLWVRRDETAIRALAQALVYEWAETDPEYAHTCSDIRKLNAMVSLAKDLLPLKETFDTDGWLFNCQNGVVDLHTGALRDHRPEDFFTKISPVPFDPTFRLTAWDNYLKSVTRGDTTLALYLQKVAGMTLLGSLPERGFYIVIGPKASGKSTFAEGLHAMAGDFAKMASFKETFGKKPGNGNASPATARLEGARVVVCSEVPKGTQIEDDLVKQFTTGDKIVARGLYQEHKEFTASATLILVCNDSPAFNIGDSALWDRIRYVEFPHTIPKDQQDRTLRDTLKNPDIGGKALLAWAVKGLLLYQEEGLNEPPCVLEWTQKQHDNQNPLAEWFYECVTVDEGAWTPAKALYESYAAWCALEGEPMETDKKRFSQYITSREGVTAVKRKDRGFKGIRLGGSK